MARSRWEKRRSCGSDPCAVGKVWRRMDGSRGRSRDDGGESKLRTHRSGRRVDGRCLLRIRRLFGREKPHRVRLRLWSQVTREAFRNHRPTDSPDVSFPRRRFEPSRRGNGSWNAAARTAIALGTSRRRPTTAWPRGRCSRSGGNEGGGGSVALPGQHSFPPGSWGDSEGEITCHVSPVTSPTRRFPPEDRPDGIRVRPGTRSVSNRKDPAWRTGFEKGWAQIGGDLGGCGRWKDGSGTNEPACEETA